MRPRLEQAPHGCCRSHLSLAKFSVHDSVMAIEHVLSVLTRVAGKLDFVSASIWRRTRTLSIVGHGVTGLRRSRSLTSSSYAAIWVCRKRNCPLVRSETVSQPTQEEKEAVWRRMPRGNGESNNSPIPDRPTLRGTLRVERPCAPPTLRFRSPRSPSIKQISSLAPRSRTILQIYLLFSDIKELKELGFLTPRMELPTMLGSYVVKNS